MKGAFLCITSLLPLCVPAAPSLGQGDCPPGYLHSDYDVWSDVFLPGYPTIESCKDTCESRSNCWVFEWLSSSETCGVNSRGNAYIDTTCDQDPGSTGKMPWYGGGVLQSSGQPGFYGCYKAAAECATTEAYSSTSTTTTTTISTTISSTITTATTTSSSSTSSSSSTTLELWEDCDDGDVRLVGTRPDIFFNGRWHAICGHYFWNNNHGAETICSMLGASGGTATRVSSTKLNSDSICVGECGAGERLNHCSSGENQFGIGQGACATIGCEAGKEDSLVVKCDFPPPQASSCKATPYRRKCTDGDVRLVGTRPDVFSGGDWYPVCGHYFWNNHLGAATICSMLGASGGHSRRVSSTKLNSDGMCVGECGEGEPLDSCSAGWNQFGRIGKDACFSIGCEAGEDDSLAVECDFSPPKASSCEGDITSITTSTTMLAVLAECDDGDVRLQGTRPDLFFNGRWHPICGHYFWNNNHGAETICSMLGASGGTSTMDSSTKLSSDAICVGECGAGERLNHCSAGENQFGIGKDACATVGCEAGKEYSLVVKCDFPPPEAASCKVAGRFLASK